MYLLRTSHALDSSKCRHCAFGLKVWSRHVKTYLNLPFALHIMPCRTVTRLARHAMQTCQNMQKPCVFFAGSEMTIFTKEWRPLTVWPWTLSGGIDEISTPLTAVVRVLQRSKLKCHPSAVPLSPRRQSLHIFTCLHMSSLLKQKLLLCDRDLVHDLTQVLSWSNIRVQHVVQCVVRCNSKKCHEMPCSATKCHKASENRKDLIEQFINCRIACWQLISSVSGPRPRPPRPPPGPGPPLGPRPRRGG